MCWLASIIGHYEWMKSWIRIVKKREVDFFETTSSQPSNISPVSSEIFVYGKVMREPDRSVPNNMLPKFISTQKSNSMVCMECYFNVDSKLCFALEICRLLLVDSLFRLFPSYGYNWILSLWGKLINCILRNIWI